MRRALIVGVDDYKNQPLSGCVNDAVEVATVIETNGDGSPNFSVVRLTSDVTEITSQVLISALEELFSGEAETALFYFAGHGVIEPVTNSGFIVTQDGSKPNWGISLSDILSMANKAHPKINSIVIVLDSCQSGFAGEINVLGGDDAPSVIGNGVTILTACQKDGYAAEKGGHGTFTSIFVDGKTSPTR